MRQDRKQRSEQAEAARAERAVAPVLEEIKQRLSTGEDPAVARIMAAVTAEQQLENLRRVALEVAPQMEQWDGYLHKEDMLLGLATDLAIWAARLRDAAAPGEE